MNKGSNKLSAGLAAVSVCCFSAAVFSALRTPAVFGANVKNDYLSLQVQDDTEESGYGSYMLKKNSGDPEDTLTYSQFYSSFAEIDINGSVKLFSEGSVVEKAHKDGNESVVAVQDFDGTQITQKLSFSTGNSNKKDMLKIEYIVENKTDENVNVSIRSIIDPTIAGTENDPIVIGTQEYTTETSFTGNDIPKEWFIYDENGGIKAYGITSGGGQSPDSFDAADWENLYNMRFDFTAEKNINDNAVAVSWNNKMLKSGENVVCSTKYGLYDGEKITAGPPKTGVKSCNILVAFGVCSLASAIVFRKRRTDENE